MHRSSTSERHYLVAHPGAELYGSDRVMLESVIGMVESGARVRVVLPQSGPLVDELRRAGADVEIVPTLVLRKSLLKPRNWGALVVGTVRGLGAAHRVLRSDRPDALYVSTVTLPLWSVSAKLHRIRCLVHLHEGEQGASRLVKMGMYAPVLLADIVIVNSDFSRGVLRQAFRSVADRAVVIYNGVAGPESVAPARTTLTENVRLVYVGRLSPRKGPDLIVEALAELPGDIPEVHLDIVGNVFPGYEWFDEQLRDRINALGLNERVRMLGFRPDIWSTVEAADALVVPSRFDEPFGNTAVEGVIAGRVVLVSDTSGLREATADCDTALRFVPDDASAIARTIQDAVSRWAELAPRLDRNRTQAAERFSPRRYRLEIASQMAAVTNSK
ncbi:glycosyltransferase [Microbacterium sp. P02]|uniref:glycosyltransferase n=1 Tax=Microbacterium sp. P02 TaxID=3366260 RepID=UPI00366D5C3B